MIIHEMLLCNCLNWCHLGPGLQLRFDILFLSGICSLLCSGLYTLKGLWSFVWGLELPTGSMILVGLRSTCSYDRKGTVQIDFSIFHDVNLDRKKSAKFLPSLMELC